MRGADNEARKRRLFDDTGKPLNVNEAGVDFRYDDSEEDNLKLELLLQKVNEKVVERDMCASKKACCSFDGSLLAALGLVSTRGGRAAALRARHH